MVTDTGAFMAEAPDNQSTRKDRFCTFTRPQGLPLSHP